MNSSFVRFIARHFMSQPRKIEVAFNLLLEAAFVRRGEIFKLEMTIYDENDPSIDVEYVGPGEFKARLGKPTAETHNNLNHCNAAGCDGMSCGPEHTKGDF